MRVQRPIHENYLKDDVSILAIEAAFAIG